MVACHQPYQEENSIKGKNNTRQVFEKRQLTKDLQNKYEVIEQKRRKLAKLEEKKKLIEYVIKRNKNAMVQEDKILRFPLLGFILQKDQFTIRERDESSILFST